MPPTPVLESDKEVKLEPEETIAARKKLNPQKRKIIGTRFKTFTPSNIINTSKSWKELIQLKKVNQTNIVSTLLTQYKKLKF